MVAVVLFPTKYTYAPTAQAQTIPAPSFVLQGNYEYPKPPVKEVVGVTEGDRCNCYKLLTASFTNVPRMAEILKTADTPMGNVAVFNYAGVPHVALVLSQGYGSFTIREWNYERCKETTREVSFADPHLVGFVTLE